jgi:AraC family transcriptional regulator
MSDLTARLLLQTDLLSVADVACCARHRHESAEECSEATHLVFPYRGLFVSHVGSRRAVIDSNQLWFINAGLPYRVSHPVEGGDDCLSLRIAEAALEELAPASLLGQGDGIFFREHRLRIDPRAQALAALLRHTLDSGRAEELEAEVMALTLIRRAFGERTARAPGGSWGRQRLVDRAKVVLASDPGRRWTLADVAAEVGVSPVYLTQVFQQVEGIPLYRYQLRLRLSRALDELPGRDDLTMLGLELGFSSHSHFTAAFRQAYGQTPAGFRQASRA